MGAIEKIISLLTLTNFPAHNLEDINLHPLPEENQFLLQINVVAIIILIINTTTTIMEMATWLFIDTITMSSICQLLYGQNQQVRKLKIRSTNHRCFDTVKRQEFMKYYVNPLQCDYHLILGIRWVNCSGCREVCRQYIESICHVHIYHSVFRHYLTDWLHSLTG